MSLIGVLAYCTGVQMEGADALVLNFFLVYWQQNSLCVHMIYLSSLCAVHLTEKSFKCTECKYSTTTRYRLVTHKNKVHAEVRKLFVCEICGARLGYIETYKEHMRRHTGDKPHQCQTCGAAFVSESDNNQCHTVNT